MVFSISGKEYFHLLRPSSDKVGFAISSFKNTKKLTKPVVGSNCVSVWKV